MSKPKIAWHKGNIPPFKSGDKVFVADRVQNHSRVLETTVCRVPVDVVWRDNQFLLLWQGWYDLETITFPEHRPPTWCNAVYVFATKKEATAAARWRSVKATDEEWLLAIGDRKIKQPEPGNIDDGCDLVIGLVNDGTSEIRNCLDEARQWGGMREVDRQHVQAIIDQCENRPEALGRTDSPLAKILSQLGLEWTPERYEKTMKVWQG